MDEIQKILVKVGRKDLAQKYYKKIAKVKLYEHDFISGYKAEENPDGTIIFYKTTPSKRRLFSEKFRNWKELETKTNTEFKDWKR